MPRAAHAWTDEDIRNKAVPGRAFSTFGQPGLMLRCGRRKHSWQVRYEGGRGAFQRQIGEWPALPVAAAREQAAALWERYQSGKPMEDAAAAPDSIASTWPRFQEWLKERGKSPKTLAAYGYSFARLSDSIKTRPLTDLAADPRLMEGECERIRKRLANYKRGGKNAAAQCAVFVSTLFNYAKRRDPKLSGNPVSACITTIPPRDDLPVLALSDIKQWWTDVQKIKNSIAREALLLTLLTGLRRGSLESLQWKNLDLKQGRLFVSTAKGDKPFDLILTRPMLRCLWRARKAGRQLFPKAAERWVFASETGAHISGKALMGYGVAANHTLRRAYATVAADAGVGDDVVSKLLNHGSKRKKLIDRYVKTSHLGRMLAAAQTDVSNNIVRLLGAPRGIA